MQKNAAGVAPSPRSPARRLRDAASAWPWPDRMVPEKCVQYGNQLAVGIERAGRVQAAGIVERALRSTQFVGHGDENVFAKNRAIIGKGFKSRYAQRVQGRFATYAATGGRVKMSLQASDVDVDTGLQFNAYHIVVAAIGSELAASVDGRNVICRSDNCFRIQETSGKLVVITRRAHCDGNAFACTPVRRPEAEANFERFFHRNTVRMRAALPLADLVDINS